jgi:hypothetical protein
MDFYSGIGDGHSVLILAQSLVWRSLRAKGVWFRIFAFVEGVRGEKRMASHGNRQHWEWHRKKYCN